MERKNTDELYKYIGKRIRRFRIDCGYTIEEAGKRLGISPRTLSAYECGTRQICALQLEKMASLYLTTYEKLTDVTNIRKRLRMYRDLTRDEGQPNFDYECLVTDICKY